MKRVRRGSFLWVAFVLAGCQIAEQQDALFLQSFSERFAQMLAFIARIFFQGSYGSAIVFLVIIVHVLLFPFMLSHYREQVLLKNKLDLLAPAFDVLHVRIREAQTKAEQVAVQQEMLVAYKEQHVNPLNTGCLALIVQVIVSVALYVTILYAQPIQAQSFLWFQLGASDGYIAVIAGISCFVQLRSLRWATPDVQQQSLQQIRYLLPLFVVGISFVSVAALPLYWSVSSILTTIESAIWRHYISRAT